MTRCFQVVFLLVIIASSLFDLAESKKKKKADRERLEDRKACGPTEKGSVMAATAAAAPSAKARKNPSAALDFVQKEYMAIDDAEKKKCVSVVEEASREYL